METSRAARLRELEKDVKYASDPEDSDRDPIERVESPVPSTPSLHNGTNTLSETSSVHDPRASGRRILRFEDGDPENPNNWGRVSRTALYVWYYGVDFWCSGRRCMPFSLQSCPVRNKIHCFHLCYPKLNSSSDELYDRFESGCRSYRPHIAAFQSV